MSCTDDDDDDVLDYSKPQMNKRKEREKGEIRKFCLRHQKRDNNFSPRAAIPTRVVCVCVCV